MHGLLAPILAQLVTLALGDRIEGHYIINDHRQYFEGSNITTAGARLTLDWRRASLTFGYAPVLTIVPLVSTPREFLLYHRALLGGQYRFRRTTLSLAATAGFGERDFVREAYLAGTGPLPAAAPTQAQGTPADTTKNPPTGTTPPGSTTGGGTTTPPAGGASNGTGSATTTATRPAVPGHPLPYGETRATAAVDHIVSKQIGLRFAAGYFASGGTSTEAQANYPIARGPDATAALRYTLDTRNVFVTTLTGQLVHNEPLEGQGGGDTFVTTLNEDYNRQFTRHTSGVVGAGVSFGRTAPIGGLPLYSIYPTGRLGMTHDARVARGKLLLSIIASTNPVLDLTSARVDPRMGFAFNVSWSRDRFSVAASGSSSVSMTRSETHAFDSVFATLTSAYNLGSGFGVDGGARAVFQSYGGTTYVQPSLVFFIGLTWGIVEPLNPSHRPARGL